LLCATQYPLEMRVNAQLVTEIASETGGNVAAFKRSAKTGTQKKRLVHGALSELSDNRMSNIMAHADELPRRPKQSDKVPPLRWNTPTARATSGKSGLPHLLFFATVASLLVLVALRVRRFESVERAPALLERI
jgi:hypothetical protein